MTDLIIRITGGLSHNSETYDIILFNTALFNRVRKEVSLCFC
jgi:hypothetical protein